ncbi:MAG TPA: sigma 54-interacting transcriptional regulator, partial [Candidatus Acidoferrum sp.]|nr:sigma 54-interacting transcriptional regulator [Candidatus Acidoferrum sp.]
SDMVESGAAFPPRRRLPPPMSMDPNTLLQTGLVTQTARARAVIRTCLCRVMNGDRVVDEIALGTGPVAVGVARECDLVLVDAQVSRRHAELQLAPDGVRVRDLGSTNGTFWQGTRLTEAVVPFGAAIRVGGTTLRLLSADVPSVPPGDRRRFGDLVGDSVALRELFAVLELAAPTDATVLIEGEPGTGKEQAARSLHDHSLRARAPFLIVECTAVSDTIIDSQLFGHVRGAFTGAVNERRGALVEASGGTVFLDEVGELSLASQAKLLRVLDAQTVQPLGGDRPVGVDTRIVAATHRNLPRMVEDKQFRFDLFYRLSVVQAAIPPLRERLDDIPALVRHFYEGRKMAPGPIEGGNLAKLERYSWPGNVRELQSVLERAWTMAGPAGASFAGMRLWMDPDGAAASHGRPLPALTGAPDRGDARTTDDLLAIDTGQPYKEAREKWLEVFEARYLEGVFEKFNRNITLASAHAGINRRHFRNLLRKHGIIEGDDE